MIRAAMFSAIATVVFGGSAFAQCTYKLVDSSGYQVIAIAAPYQGGTNGTFASNALNVSTGTGCSWGASTTTSWIHINGGQQGSGPGPVTFTVDQNNGDSRIGSMKE